MSLRNVTLALAVVLSVSIWSACRSGGKSAHAQGADPIYSETDADACGSGNHDDAARRYRSNQSTHWRQVAIGARN